MNSCSIIPFKSRRLLLSFSWLILLFGLSLVYPLSCLSVEELIFSDNFSQGLEQWQHVRGRQEAWTVEDGWLIGHSDYANQINELKPAASLWPGGEHGYRLEFGFKMLQGVDVNWTFGFIDPDNWYEIHFTSNFFELARVRDGRCRFGKSWLRQLELNREYQVAIEFETGRIQLWIDGEQLVDIAKDELVADELGSISLKVTSGFIFPTKVGFRDIRVWSLVGGDYLKVNIFKQTDSRWAGLVYDHALEWAVPGTRENSSIARWGCALSSMAMILDFYGLDILPGGDQLTPKSLNQWLAHQPDGYVQRGSVNWLAGSRLSGLISAQQSSSSKQLPKLEFHRHSMPGNSDLANAIKLGRPQILQLPGHFLVASGVDPSQRIVIEDPYYDYQLLDQHRETVFSSIDYRPSQTDLSSVLLVYPTDAKIRLRTGDGVDIEGIQLFQDTLSSQGQTNSGVISQLMNQPESGEYQLEIEYDQPEWGEWSVYWYDRFGGVGHRSFLLFGLDEPLSYQLVVSKDAAELGYLKLNNLLNWSQLADGISTLELSAAQVDQINQIQSFARQVSNDARSQGRYLQLLLMRLREQDLSSSLVRAVLLALI